MRPKRKELSAAGGVLVAGIRRATVVVATVARTAALTLTTARHTLVVVAGAKRSRAFDATTAARLTELAAGSALTAAVYTLALSGLAGCAVANASTAVGVAAATTSTAISFTAWLTRTTTDCALATGADISGGGAESGTGRGVLAAVLARATTRVRWGSAGAGGAGSQRSTAACARSDAGAAVAAASRRRAGCVLAAGHVRATAGDARGITTDRAGHIGNVLSRCHAGTTHAAATTTTGISWAARLARATTDWAGARSTGSSRGTG